MLISKTFDKNFFSDLWLCKALPILKLGDEANKLEHFSDCKPGEATGEPLNTSNFLFMC